MGTPMLSIAKCQQLKEERSGLLGEHEEKNSLIPLPIAYCSRPNTQYGGGSCVDQCFGGFVLGATLGSVVGVLFGGLQVMAGGPEMKGLRLRIFLKTVGGSALSFGVFLMAGSAIRCEEQTNHYGERALARYQGLNHMQRPAGFGLGLGAIFVNSPWSSLRR